MAVTFKLGDRVWVARRTRWAVISHVNAERGVVGLNYGEEIQDSFNRKFREEELPFSQVAHEQPEPPALSEGDTLLVTWGTEKYSPRQYMNFDVGPLSATTKIRPGETADEAHARVWRWLEARAREQFNSQLNRFRINLQEL